MPGNDANTILLLHMDGADAGTTFTDSAIGTGAPHTVSTNFTVQTKTASFAAPKFDSASCKIAGTGANSQDGGFLSVANAAEFRFGTGDFCIDWWSWQNGSGGNYTFYSMGYTAAGAILLQTDASNPPKLKIFLNNVLVLTETTGAALSGWHHRALNRSGTSLTLWLDGAANGSATDSTNISNTSTIAIGARQADGFFACNGNIDEFRVSNVSRFTSTFTPQAAPYGIAQTLSLAAGAYALTGKAATFAVGHFYSLVCTAGAYALNGAAATMKKAVILTASAGAYSLTGAAATLRRALRFTASAGSYALTGSVMRFKFGFRADAGSYALVGSNLIGTAIDAGQRVIRSSLFVLQKLRTTTPNLDQ